MLALLKVGPPQKAPWQGEGRLKGMAGGQCWVNAAGETWDSREPLGLRYHLSSGAAILDD